MKGVALCHFVNGMGNEIRWRVLEQVAVDVSIDDLLDVLVRPESREEDDSHIRRELANLASRSKAVQAGHSDIHEQDMRAFLDGEIDRLATVVRLADNLDGLVEFEQGAQRLADEGVVVYDHELDRGDRLRLAWLVR